MVGMISGTSVVPVSMVSIWPVVVWLGGQDDSKADDCDGDKYFHHFGNFSLM